MKKIVGIDLFCGIGGLTNGLVNAGIDIRAGFDIDETCKISFEQPLNNNPIFINKDIKTLSKKDFMEFFDDSSYKLVAGCAPCQPYSAHQKKKKTEDRMSHDSYGLIEEYLRIVKLIKPEFVVMENVANLQKDPFFETKFINFFNTNNYHIDHKIVNIAKYGAPQRRKRLLFIAVSKEIPNYKTIQIPESTNAQPQTVFDAIGNLPHLKNGMVDVSDPLHISASLEAKNLARIQVSVEGGTWRDWPSELLPECYKKESGKTYTSVYGRMNRNDVAPTLTTQFTRYGTGRYGHYEQDRAISLREGAILQTFPITYKFDSLLGITALARQIGNAVPPLAAKVIGEIFVKSTE